MVHPHPQITKSMSTSLSPSNKPSDPSFNQTTQLKKNKEEYNKLQLSSTNS